MTNFNFYLNRQGSRGRQGVKGDKGDNGYSPYIDIKSNTPTEFIMTIHNETESFDTPNLIPTAIGEKVTEMDAVLTTHTEDIANLKLEDQAIKNKNNAQDSDIAALKTRVNGTIESIEDLNHKYTVLGSEVSDLSLKKQNRLVEGANITLTNNEDGTTTISASGGGGGGSDTPIATTQVAGKVKPDGTTITITDDGTISAVGGGGTLPDNVALLDKQQVFTETQSLRKGLIVSGSTFGDYAQIELRDSTDTSKYINISHQVLEDGSSSTNFVPYTPDKNIMTVGSIEMVSNSSQVSGNITTIRADKLKRGKFDGTEGYAILDTTSIKAGQNITIDKNEEAGTITINSSGGGGTPENMMTIDTNQTVSGVKTFTNRVDIGISGLESRITTTNNSESGQRQDLSIVSSGDLTLSTGNVAFTDSDGGSHVRQGKIIDGSGNIVLTQGNVTAGNNITITKTGKGIQIASSGGGSTPTNMVTTDTQQTITASKTITAHDALSSPVKGGALTFENQDGASGYCAISIRKGSGDAIGYTPICQLSSDSFSITQSEQAFNGYAQNRIQLTLQNAVPEIVLGNYQGSSRILHDDKGLNITNSAGNSGIFIPWNGDGYKNQAGLLNIGSNSLRYYKDSENYVDLLASGSSEPPANMVTTDTNQDITGIKTFKGDTSNNDPSIIFGGKRIGLDDSIGGKIKVNGNDNFEISTGAKGDSGLILRMSRNANNSPSYFEFTSNSSDIPPAIKLGKTNYQGTIEYDTSTYPNGFLFKTQSALSGYPYSSFKMGDDTLTFKKTDGTVVDLLNNSSKEQYGIRADYALTHGIVDNPNDIISHNDTDKNITVKQGLVLKTAGTNANKTTIASDMQHTVTSTGNFTLFYANGELLECGKVDYSTEEPTGNGITNYQAWFNPDKTVNTNQQWQFKSNDTGNVWRYVDNATPLADIVADSTAITSISYLGYRIFDDDVFAHKNEWVYVNKQLLNNVNRTAENIVVDLSDSLPNDGATYDVLFSSQAQPVNEKNKFVAVFPANDEISPAMRVAQGRVAVAGVDALAYGAFLLPITSSRNIKLGGSSSSNNGGTISLWMHAYKKIG